MENGSQKAQSDEECQNPESVPKQKYSKTSGYPLSKAEAIDTQNVEPELESEVEIKA